MPLTKEKRKLTKLIQQSDSDESDHELSHYVNDRIKLMKEVLKTVKPKKIKAMAPSCLKNLEIEEINSMLLEELLGISNKRLKYIFNGQNPEEDSSTTSEDEPVDVISLDDVSDDDLVINVEDDEDTLNLKQSKRGTKRHHKCKKEKIKTVMKKEEDSNKKTSQEAGIDSKKNLMNVLELLELQARARAIKSQLLLENVKVQESINLSKIPTLEEKVGSDDDVIIKTTKAEEIVITSSDDENQDVSKEKNASIDENNEENIKVTDAPDLSKDSEHSGEVEKILEVQADSNSKKINIIENRELSAGVSVEIQKNELNIENSSEEIVSQSEDTDKIKISDNDGIIQINLSDDEIDSMKLT